MPARRDQAAARCAHLGVAGKAWRDERGMAVSFWDRFQGQGNERELRVMLRELHDVIQGDGDPARKMELAERILAMDDTAHALGPEKRGFVLVVQGQSLGQLALQRGDEEARALLERAKVCFDAALGVLTLQAYPAFRATALQYKAEALS